MAAARLAGTQGFAYDFYADDQLHDGTLDLDRYRVLILSMHPEYWSAEMYWTVKRWVFERGGRLLYLGGNGLNCQVEFLDDGTAHALSRTSGRPACESRFHHQVESEANLLGVVFTDPGAMTVAPYEVIEPRPLGLRRHRPAARRPVRHQTLHERYGHGASGHETDKISPSSPKNVQLLAKGLNPDDGGAHLVYLRHPQRRRGLLRRLDHLSGGTPL